MNAKILIVEDDLFQSRILRKILESKLGYEAIEASSAEAAITILQQHDLYAINLIILDLGLPDMHGLDLIEKLKSNYPKIPIIVLSSTEKQSDATIALRKGAIDFMDKPPHQDRLSASIQNALVISSLYGELEKLRRSQDGQVLFSDLIGHDQGLSVTIDRAKKAAASDISVLITGDTGVGKELFARAIHGESKRYDKAFVAINCAAIPKQLIESTLFGHEKGSFTGAIEKSLGKFREADGGTLFLDEIGELPLDAQVKLLRTLQQMEVDPVGATQSIPIDVRIIAATNRNLSLEVQNGMFREDLFFRIEGLPLTVPPLRERKEDIPALVEHFLHYFSKQDGLIHKKVSQDGLKFIQQNKWLGNVRELQHTLHRVLLLSEGSTITYNDVKDAVSGSRKMFIDAGHPKLGQYVEIINAMGDIKTLDTLEKEAMSIVTDHFHHNITKASNALGIAKSTFYRKWKNNQN